MKSEKKFPPLRGEGLALHHVGCRTKALNLIWFRGGGDNEISSHLQREEVGAIPSVSRESYFPFGGLKRP